MNPLFTALGYYPHEQYIDVEGHEYPVIKFGKQLWLGHNLSTKYDNCGRIIDAFSISTDENKYFAHHCGYYYPFPIAKRLAIDEWRLPTMDDYLYLISCCYNENWFCVANKDEIAPLLAVHEEYWEKSKLKDTVGWAAHNRPNKFIGKTLFCAFPAGYSIRDCYERFHSERKCAMFWTSTRDTKKHPHSGPIDEFYYAFCLSYNEKKASFCPHDRFTDRLPVRLVKDI